MTYSRSSHTYDPLYQPMDLKLYYCGSQDCAPGHSWGPGLKDHYKLHYIRRGRGMLRLGSQAYPLEAGQGFLIRPEQVAFYQADEAEPWSYSWAAFSGPHAGTYLDRAGLTPEQPVFTCLQGARLQACFSDMLEAQLHPDSRDLRLLAALYSLLSVLIDSRAAPVRSGPPGRLRDVYAARAVAFIETNYSRSMTVEELAAELGLDRKYAARLFKEVLGVPPQQFLLQYRLEQACGLLHRPALSIADISRSVGYKDPLLFSRMFKKHRGVSPQQYRRQLPAVPAPEL